MGGSCSTEGERRGVYGVLVGILKERYQLEYPGIDGTIIRRWTFRNCDVGARTGSSWLRIRIGGEHL